MAGKDGGGIQQIYERNQEATIYVGNLDPKIDDEVLWELMVQCGPVANIHLPRDKITNTHQGYGFVEFKNEEDADYTIKIMNMIRLFGKPIRCNKSSQDKKTSEVGANLFVGNLEPEVDEKMLYDTFTAFGVLLFAKVMRDPDTGQSRGFGFISYDSFEASDSALAGMNGQFLCNRPISVSYAYKKETKGERHGTAAERLMAANRPKEGPSSMAAAPALAGGMPPPLMAGGGPPPGD
jgi:splicing factor 3B subunit 4